MVITGQKLSDAARGEYYFPGEESFSLIIRVSEVFLVHSAKAVCAGIMIS